ncbi:MAG: S-methyl-5'-thioadenosine phosphorylase [Bacteroidales bacterium]|nr:S-methyl-5'-thioadenosine phosphorylase [Bacteroidales bacterium]MCF8334115.1 S-methyl-5'-thioadenosine phosphorylase [Bacteroidales bacterium]
MKIGIIGGTGLEQLNIFEESGEVSFSTPYGKTSSTFFKGISGNNEIYILSRHGRSHSIPPTQVNNRANIFAMKELGIEAIIATTACGSLRDKIGVGHLVFPDQFIDFTRHRDITFFDKFEEGKLGHISMPDPFDDNLRNKLTQEAAKLNLNYHSQGTLVTIEGPRFSTRAESRMFQSWGGDIINMSIAPEVILANELGIPYATVAISTDYDSWKTDEEGVTWEEVLKVFKSRVETVKTLMANTLLNI